jgi:hypothetical protein
MNPKICPCCLLLDYVLLVESTSCRPGSTINLSVLSTGRVAEHGDGTEDMLMHTTSNSSRNHSMNYLRLIDLHTVTTRIVASLTSKALMQYSG